MPQLEGHLPAGSYTTDDVLALMRTYAIKDSSSPEIRTLAGDITQGLHPEDSASIMLAVRNWILVNLSFIKDPDEAIRLFGDVSHHMEHGELEMVKSPVVVLETKRYDCDCISSLIASVLINFGIPCRFVAVSFHPESMTGPDGYSHVFCQGLDRDGLWFTIDPVSHPHEKRMLERDTKQWKIFEVS